MDEKRISPRKLVCITTVIKKIQADGNYQIMEFLSLDLSNSGVFILVEDLAIFDLGDELEVLVDVKGDKYYEGNAKVVRSARIFDKESNQARSGFGLMFLNPNEDFKEMLAERLENVTDVAEN